MNKLFSFLFMLIIISLSYCKGTTEDKTQTSPTTQEKRNKYTADDGHTVGIAVELNNGAKWEANVETTNEIGAMVGMVKELSENAALEDYRGVQKRLAVSFQTILQKCTMKGEAHNQLHNYLMPLKEKIDKLGDCDPASCKTLASDIKDYLLKYSHFFFS